MFCFVRLTLQIYKLFYKIDVLFYKLSINNNNMNTLKEENRRRIQKAYDLCKFALKNKSKEKKVTEVFEDVAKELGYKNPGRIATIYYEEREKDTEPLDKFKVKKNSKTVAYEN